MKLQRGHCGHFSFIPKVRNMPGYQLNYVVTGQLNNYDLMKSDAHLDKIAIKGAVKTHGIILKKIFPDIYRIKLALNKYCSSCNINKYSFIVQLDCCVHGKKNIVQLYTKFSIFTPVKYPEIYIDYSSTSLSWFEIIVKYTHSKPEHSFERLVPGMPHNLSLVSGTREHVLMIQLSEKQQVQCILSGNNNNATPLAQVSFKIDLDYRPLSGWPLSLVSGHQRLFTQLLFSCSKPVQFISVAGNITNIEYTFKQKNSELEAIWIHPYENNIPQYNYKQNTSQFKIYSKINNFNYSFSISMVKLNNKILHIVPRNQNDIMNDNLIISNRRQTSIFRLFYFYPTIIYKEAAFHSWNSASDICTQLSGHLPVLVDKSDVEELVAMLKRKEYQFLAIFIGLQVSLLIYIIFI